MREYFMRLQNCTRIVQGSLILNMVTSYLFMLSPFSLISSEFQTLALFYLKVYKYIMWFHPFMLCIYGSPSHCLHSPISKSCLKTWLECHFSLRSFQILSGRNNCIQSVTPLQFKNSLQRALIIFQVDIFICLVHQTVSSLRTC